MNIRSQLFWLKDYFQGKHIKNHKTQIEKYLYGEEKENILQLNAILRWSVEQTTFYSKYSGFKSIDDFPIINKTIVREKESQFLAKRYKKEKLFKEETSGSTGTPFIVYQDSQKRLRSAADTIVFSKYAGYNFGTRLYYSRVWNSKNKKSPFTQTIQNIIMVESSKLSDDDMQAFIDTLEKDHSIKSVLIFSSTLTVLYNFMRKYNKETTAKVECFITMSESLPTEVRKGIEELFRAPVVSRYSNSECGILAQQCKDSDEYHINTGSFFIEILKMNSDLRAEEGEIGRIVVTDLYNKAMPLIRYDTGDIGAFLNKPKCGNGGKVLSHVGGRRADCIYNTQGEMISPFAIINTLWGYYTLKQYQFIQEDAFNYTLLLNSGGKSFDQETELINRLKEYIGENAIILPKYVNEIPLLSSGKRKQVVCNYVPNS